MPQANVHTLAWIAAIVLAILALVGVDFPALEIAVLAAAAGELFGT